MPVLRDIPPDLRDPGARVPVLIVGAGACGLSAALTLADAGVECVVLERDALPSGSTALSSGFIPACGTRFQAEIGVADSLDLFVADILHKNRHQANPRMVRAVCAASGPALEWLADRHGIPFHVIDGFLYPGHSVPRMHAVPEKTGRGLIDRLSRAAELAGIALVNEARVNALYVEAGSDVVRGVRILRPDGSTEDIGCDALILACNGFGGNPEMVRHYMPEIAPAEYAGHPGNQGDAVQWGLELGATVSDMGAYQGHGSWATPHGQLVTWALMMDGGIQVNANGERFWNEHLGYSEASQQVIAQPGGVAWDIYDARLDALGASFPDYVELERVGAIRHAPTAHQLAALLGIDGDGLAATLDACAQFRSGGRPCPFGRDFTRSPALEAPYYAVKVTGALFHTQGGLEVDDGARVLRQDGAPFPNLYAGGGAARGVSGSAVWGYLSGNGLLTAITLGRLAAQSIAATLSERAGR